MSLFIPPLVTPAADAVRAALAPSARLAETLGGEGKVVGPTAPPLPADGVDLVGHLVVRPANLPPAPDRSGGAARRTASGLGWVEVELMAEFSDTPGAQLACEVALRIALEELGYGADGHDGAEIALPDGAPGRAATRLHLSRLPSVPLFDPVDRTWFARCFLEVLIAPG